MRKANRLTHAITFLTQGIDAGKWLPSGQLSSLNILAESAGVSRATIWKAVTELKRKGKLATTERGKMFLSSHIRAHLSDQLAFPSEIWQQKRAMIERDIHAGILTASGGVLPTSGALGARYGVSFRTLRKILKSLVQDGVIVPFNRSYMVPRLEQKKYGSTIRLVADSASSLFSQKFSREFVAGLERECAQHAISLEMIFISWIDANPDLAAQRIAQYAKPVIAHIIHLEWYEGRHPEKLNGILRAAIKTGLPVAIADMTGSFVPPHEFLNPLVRVFRIASTAAGSTLGQFVLSMGHERTAYLSSQHYYQWSKQRLEGLANRYARAGLADCLSVAVSEDIGGYYERMFAASGLDREQFLGMIQGNPQEPLFTAAVDSDEPVSAQEVFENTPKKTRAEIQGDFKRLHELSKKGFSPENFSDIRDAVFLSVNKRVNRANEDALFNRALAFPDISAWVCSSDDMALSAMQFLAENGRQVPRSISVCGFDNVPQGLDAGLTTYDFNFPVIVSRMMRFMLESGNHSSKMPADCVVDSPGLIIQRMSVGRLKKRLL